MSFYKTVEIAAQKFRKDVLVTGSVWGLLQLAVLLVTWVHPSSIGPSPSEITPYPINLIGVLLITGIAFLVGYTLLELEKSYKALLVSQLVAYSCLYLIIRVFPSPFSYILSGSVSPGLLYLVGLPFLSMILAVAATGLGAIIGESKTGLRETGIRINSYQSFFVGALVIILLVSGTIFAAGLVSQNNSLRSENADLNSENHLFGSHHDNPVYNYSSPIAQRSKSWTVGTENITLWPTFFPARVGYIRVSWNSTTNISFHMNILDASYGSPSGVSGSYTVPIIQPVEVDGSSWFHNDRCPTTCPAGNMNYTIDNWWDPW